MLQSLLYPAAAAAGMILGEKAQNAIVSRLPGSVGPGGPMPATPVMRFGVPAAMFAAGWLVNKKASGTPKALGTGLQIGAIIHLAASLLPSWDYNFGS